MGIALFSLLRVLQFSSIQFQTLYEWGGLYAHAAFKTVTMPNCSNHFGEFNCNFSVGARICETISSHFEQKNVGGAVFATSF